MSRTKKGKYEQWISNTGLEKVKELASKGLSDGQLAEMMGIAKSTFYSWIRRYPELTETIAKAREIVNDNVENALYQTAIGGTVQVEVTEVRNKKGELMRTITKTKHIPPNAMAAMCWLKHKLPDKWGDW